MAKNNLISILSSLQGKLTKTENICFRRTPTGGNSVYFQQDHSYESLHSPAQQRHRQLLAQASRNAAQILADPSQTASYLIQYHNYPKRYSSLQRFIVHLEYLRLKAI